MTKLQKGIRDLSDTIDRSFKYTMQDTTRIYVGGRMTYQEMIEWDDVPFKIKAIVNKEFVPNAGTTEITFAEHFKSLETDSFLFQVLKTLKTKIKVDIPTLKKGKSSQSIIYKSKICTIEEYLSLVKDPKYTLVSEDGTEISPVTEEISFSKLAVMIYSA